MRFIPRSFIIPGSFATLGSFVIPRFFVILSATKDLIRRGRDSSQALRMTNMASDGQKWPLLDKNGVRMTNMASDGQKWPWLDKKGLARSTKKRPWLDKKGLRMRQTTLARRLRA